MYNPPEVAYHPSHSDIISMLKSITTSIQETARSFPRWRDKHCEKVAPISGSDDEVVYKYTFHDDMDCSDKEPEYYDIG